MAVQLQPAKGGYYVSNKARNNPNLRGYVDLLDKLCETAKTMIMGGSIEPFMIENLMNALRYFNSRDLVQVNGAEIALAPWARKLRQLMDKSIQGTGFAYQISLARIAPGLPFRFGMIVEVWLPHTNETPTARMCSQDEAPTRVIKLTRREANTIAEIISDALADAPSFAARRITARHPYYPANTSDSGLLTYFVDIILN